MAKEKRIVLKARKDQRGRPRKIDQEKYNNNWDRIFGNKEKKQLEKVD